MEPQSADGRRPPGRNRAMEFYRFAAAVLILCYHCYWFAFREEGTQFVGFYLLVELFFILSGFLMLRSVRLHATRADRLDPAGAAVRYVRGRLRRFYPQHLLSWMLVAVIELVLMRDLWPIELLRAGWSELLLVNVFGFVRGVYVNIVCWYLSALIFASLFIYYFLVKNEDGFLKIAAPLILVLCYGALFDRKGSLANTIIFTQYSAPLGFMRATADLTAGCVAYRVYEWLEEVELPGERALATVLELSVLAASWLWMYRRSGIYDFLFVPLFCGFVISVFRGRSWLTRLLDNPLSAWLGGRSMAYFLNNLVVIYPCMVLFPELELWPMCLVCAPACLIVSALTDGLLRRRRGA